MCWMLYVMMTVDMDLTNGCKPLLVSWLDEITCGTCTKLKEKPVSLINHLIENILDYSSYSNILNDILLSNWIYYELLS